MTTIINAPAHVLSNQDLIKARRQAQAMLAQYESELGHIDQMIHARLDVTEATALTDDDGVILVKRTPRTPDYDQGLLVALKEAPGFAGEAYKESWVEEWIKETTVAAHWDMQQVKKWARTLGKPVLDILDRARLPGKPGKLEFAEVPAADAG